MITNEGNNIEVELRAEVSLKQLDGLFDSLKEKSKLVSDTKRLSVMFLGSVNHVNFDIRVRISSDGNAELVVKKGDYHAHNRVESSQRITKDQFIGIVKIFSLFGFQSKVTERENFVFDLGDDIAMVLVKAGSIAYVEIEKMSDDKNADSVRDGLLKTLEDLQLKPIGNGDEFNELCDRLTQYSDWVFSSSAEDTEKLEKILASY